MNVAEQKIVRVYPDAKSEQKEILLLKEHTLLIKVNGAAWTSLVCADTNLMELVAGHLLSSGLIEKKADIARIDFCETKRKAAVFLNRVSAGTGIFDPSGVFRQAFNPRRTRRQACAGCFLSPGQTA